MMAPGCPLAAVSVVQVIAMVDTNYWAVIATAIAVCPCVALAWAIAAASRDRLGREAILDGAWEARFAWMPRRLSDGCLAWLCRIEERPLVIFRDGLGLY